MTVIAQQDTTRFMLAAGREGEVEYGQVFDMLTRTLGPRQPVATITAHSPGWEAPPSAPPEVLAHVEELAAA